MDPRVNASRQVTESETRLALAIEAASLGLFDLDLAENLVYWSPRNCEIHGVPAGAPLGLDACMALLPPDEVERVREALEQALHPAGDGRYRIEHRIVRPDGDVRWVHALGRVTFETDAQGTRRAVRFTGVTQDITDRHLAMQRLIESERACRRSEERLRLATESSTLGWWDTDLVAGRTQLSDNAHRMLGLAPPGPDGYPNEAVIVHLHPDDRDGVLAARQQALDPAGDGLFRHQYRVLGADGQCRWVDAMGCARFEHGADGTRRPVRFAGVLWDLTSHQRMVAALADSEARFRLLADTMPQIVWATRPDGYHDYFNERWYEYTGMPRPDEPGGEHDPEGSGQGWNWKDWLHPDDQAATFDAWSKSLATGAPYHVEYRFKRRDGQYRWFIGRALPLRDAGGAITRWFGTLTDIHAQKAAEAERQALVARLADSEARLRTVFDTVPVGIVTAEAPGGRVTGGNRRAEAVFGHPILPSANIDDYRDWVAFHPDGRQVEPEEYPMARALMHGEANATLEVHYRRGDGTRAWIRLVASPIRDPDTGTITGGVVVALDIDAERRALDALREADHRKDEFLAMLAHELRNPLAPLVNAHRLLARDPLGDDQRRAALAMAERQTRQLTRLVDDLLEVSRITRGKIALRCEAVMVGSAIWQAVDSMTHECTKRRHAVAVHVPPHPVVIHADPARLAQVLENLLANACKYTPDGGRIDVSLTETADDGIEIRVADTGIGIEADKLETVFELFHQVDATLDRAQGGLGIGLGLVRRLVELHGGRVHAESAGRGQGSVFIVRLPRRSTDEFRT